MKQIFQRNNRYRKIIYLVIGVTFILVILHPSTISFNHIISEDFDSNLDINNSVVDISIQKCFSKAFCNPPAGWIISRTPLSLNSRRFMFYNYYLISKKHPLHDATRVMTDFQITTNPVSPTDQDWIQESYGKLILWKQYASTNQEDFQEVDVIREVDILHGDKDLQDSRPHWDFQFQDLPLPFDSEVPVHLTLFKLSELEQPLYEKNITDFSRLKREGKIITSSPNFKLMQLSDLHFSQYYENCKANTCKLDLKTLKFIENSIVAEKVDFVVITGDLIDMSRVTDYKSVILKSLSPILQNNIPFFFTFGELDINESNESKAKPLKYQVLQFISTLPNCYNYVPLSDQNIHGLTNYNLKVYQNLETEPKSILTILDSEDHKIDSSQMNYLYRINQEYPQKISKLLFFHYPLPNFRPKGVFKLIGSYNEKHELNSKSSHKYRDDIANCGYNVISVGYEHENDACILSDKRNPNNQEEILNQVWLCYNGITGDSGETKLNEDFDRKLRIFDIRFDTQKLISWKRSETNGIGFDYQVISQLNNI